MADKFNHKVQNGDMIVMASDGLWDNMDDNQIISEI
jgi:serine/threonine protein phosphatase PrpC